ncbi:MAG: DNA starvation/stationary phase protection protein [Candidatus Nanopelagicales bacterium]
MATTKKKTQKSAGKRAKALSFTVPGVSQKDAATVVTLLQDRLNALTDLSLTLKHIHWNVTGPHFIAVHTMLDPQYAAVAAMVDEVAERIATLGGSPTGTPGALVASRSWDDYSIGRADAISHLAALDLVYDGVVGSHRSAIEQTETADPVTQDMLIGQSAQLEQFQWFVRAHLEDAGGELVNAGAATEDEAAASTKAPR